MTYSKITVTAAAFALSMAGQGLAAHAADVQAKFVAAKPIHMPAGDITNAARKQMVVKGQLLGYALPAAKLKALKAAKGAADGSALAPEATDRAAAGAPTVVKTCTTNSFDMWTPSDINGAASASHLVAVTNDAISLYRTDTCSVTSRMSLEQFVAGALPVPDTQEIFDPRVMFDASVGRFVVTAESYDDLNFDQYQYLAVSTDATASDWYIYQIALSEGTNLFCKLAIESFWDYPIVGRSSNRWFITANDFPSGRPDEGGESGRVLPTDPRAAILSIDKAPTLTGGPVAIKCFNNKTVNMAPPIVKTADTQALFLATDGTGEGSRFTVYGLTASGKDANSDTLQRKSSAVVPAWTLAPNAPQPNGQTLDVLDGRFQAPSVQINRRIWNVHTINVNGHARWRLYKFANTSTGMKLRAMITPSTTVARNDNLFNPSVDTRSSDPSDVAWVTFTRTIPSNKGLPGHAAMMMAKGSNSADSGWASRLIAMSLEQYWQTGFRGGSTSCNADPDIATCRWGDYSSTQIDPVDSNRAWGFNQLIIGRTSKNWSTKGSLVK
jgi:hypothetical protein